MKIKVDPFDEKSIDEALKQIEEYKARFAKREEEFLQKLADIGVGIADDKFKAADYDGDNDVTVKCEMTDTGVRLIASGEAVAFIEFGAGVARGGGYLGEKPAGIVGLGEYGKKKGATGKPWYYAHGKKTDGNPPAMGMYYARNEIVEKVIDTAREVFGRD